MCIQVKIPGVHRYLQSLLQKASSWTICQKKCRLIAGLTFLRDGVEHVLTAKKKKKMLYRQHHTGLSTGGGIILVLVYFGFCVVIGTKRTHTRVKYISLVYCCYATSHVKK